MKYLTAVDLDASPGCDLLTQILTDKPNPTVDRDIFRSVWLGLPPPPGATVTQIADANSATVRGVRLVAEAEGVVDGYLVARYPAGFGATVPPAIVVWTRWIFLWTAQPGLSEDSSERVNYARAIRALQGVASGAILLQPVAATSGAGSASYIAPHVPIDLTGYGR